MLSSSLLKAARFDFRPTSRAMKWSYRSQIRDLALQPRTCQEFSIGFGRHKEPSTWVAASGYPSPNASSRLTVGDLGLLVNRAKAVYLHSLFLSWISPPGP